MTITYLGQRGLGPLEIKLMGGKASSLHVLKAANFNVPSGFVLSSELSDLEEALATIGGFPVAVRSSGAMEDLPNASFAGLYETFLFVSSMDELKQKIHDCLESRHSLRVKDYLDHKGISYRPEQLKMTVLVQKMIDPAIAGVLFTLNPINGHDEEMYVEYCEGVGERLVSGHVTPTQVRYDWMKDSLISEVINQEGTKLSGELLKKLITQSALIQAHYGHPQDIEWAVDKKGELFILQSRPVTSYLPREDKPELTNADFKDGGVSARVCTQAMYSIYREALQVSMGDYFQKINLIKNPQGIVWIHYCYGRVYWNAEAVKEGLKNIPGYREEDFDRDLGVQKEYGPSGCHVTPTNPITILKAIPILFALNREFSDCEAMVDQFRDKFEVRDLRLKEDLKQIKSQSSDAFHVWFMEVIIHQLETERSYFRTIYNNANYQSEYKGFIKKLKGYLDGDEIDLMGNLQGVTHLDVQGDLGKLAKIADFYGLDSQKYHEGREKFLDAHYHHGPAELDLKVARWGENKEWVDELVKNFVHHDHQVKDAYTPTFTRLESSAGFFKKKKLIEMTKRTRNFLRIREEMRAYSTRAYYLLRLGILEFAKRTGMSETDVFLLDILEIRKKIMDPLSPLPSLEKNRLYYESYRSFTPPNEFGGTIKMKESTSTGQLKGLGCSPGVFEGVARVILDIHKTHELTKNEILITAFTDPGWTPVLAKVGGVVTEVGGLLSHAAVIGREYGIPAILNLNNATKIIGDGDLIRMNGKTGEVEILEKASKG
jgi:phosphohistidine swiveling domain-containing protein